MAMDAMVRIESGGAYANLILPDMLAKSDLSDPDRRFVTQLVYGTTRMKRACDHLVDRFLLGPADEQVRAALRIGTFQLVFLNTPPHAAVDATVSAVAGGGRKVVNAVLRRVAKAPVQYPDEPTRLSYPSWIYKRLIESLGQERAVAALEAMNRPATATTREDGYVQDRASQLVVAAVEAQPGDVAIDLCAAPGGKATGLAAAGATVVAGDRRLSRVGLVADNVASLGYDVAVLAADGRHSPFRAGSADRVLVDAPCSGFGSLRSRPDARWRIDPQAPARLAELQFDLLASGVRLLKADGVLIYSVCTFGDAEGANVVNRATAELGLELLEPPGQPWQATDGIAMLVPGAAAEDGNHDGMMLARFRRA